MIFLIIISDLILGNRKLENVLWTIARIDVRVSEATMIKLVKNNQNTAAKDGT
jgi:hypothetical protein